ncbi:14028_t:CDS:2, partial [Racocetra fulgida]
MKLSEDSAEFLRVILDKLHEELPYPQSVLNNTQTNGNTNNHVNVNYSPSMDAGVNAMMDDYYACGISSTSSTSSTTTSKNYEGFQRRTSSSTSIISDIFQDVFESKIKCLHCMKESIKEEYFYVLPIQIDKKYKLKSQEKNLNGVLNTVIGLDMRPYCKEPKESSNNSKYSLYGLIHHRGVIGGGHYVAYVKNPIDNNWYEFDDTLNDMVVKIPFSVYTLLMEKYGTDGSPPFHADDYGRAGCQICEVVLKEERMLDQRRRKEARDINQIDTNVIRHVTLRSLIVRSISSLGVYAGGGSLAGSV